MIFNTIYDSDGKRRPFQYSRASFYISGRWPRRDGDTYGIVAPQPPIKIAEPARADDPSGDIRSSHVS